MIKQVKIQNFQSHEDTVLEFHPGVNIIVGTSDAGKTAVIRAIRLVAFNKPSGDSYRSTWGGETKVEIDTDTHTITRRKHKGENQYILSGLDTPFAAFGNKVPAEVEMALNLTEINVQQQMDAPFLLTASTSPGAVATHFNKIAHLEVIDTARSNIDSWGRSLSSTINYKEAQVKQQKELLPAFEFIDKFEIDLDVLDGLWSSYLSTQTKGTALSGLIADLMLIDEELEKNQNILKHQKEVVSLIKLSDEIKDIDKAHAILNAMIIEIKATSEQLYEERQFLKCEKDSLKLLAVYEELRIIRVNIASLKLLKFQIDTTVQEIENSEEQRFEDQTTFSKNMPDICPLCNTQLS